MHEASCLHLVCTDTLTLSSSSLMNAVVTHIQMMKVSLYCMVATCTDTKHLVMSTYNLASSNVTNMREQGVLSNIWVAISYLFNLISQFVCRFKDFLQLFDVSKPLNSMTFRELNMTVQVN